MSNASIRESPQPALAAISQPKELLVSLVKAQFQPLSIGNRISASRFRKVQTPVEVHALNLAGQIVKKRLQIDNEAKIKTINLALRFRILRWAPH